jgi:hypothetical protein
MHGYFEKTIVETIHNCHSVREQKAITVNPEVLYEHIIHSSQSFNKSIMSVDMDLMAWYCACEPTCFDELTKYCENSGRIEQMKKDFLSQYKAYRRTNLTYKISQNIIERINNPSNGLGRNGTVRRLIVIDKKMSDFTEKDILILIFFDTITKDFTKKIHNKCMIKSKFQDGSLEKSKLESLQDIILFDEEIAYRELLNEKKESNESKIITNIEEIKAYEKDFSYLFDRSHELSHILSEISASRKEVTC